MLLEYDWELGLPASCSIEQKSKKTMAITTWSLFIDHIVMLLCHVMFTKVILIKMHPYQVTIGLISSTSPLTSIMICQVSPNPMGVLKPILLHLRLRDTMCLSIHPSCFAAVA